MEADAARKKARTEEAAKAAAREEAMFARIAEAAATKVAQATRRCARVSFLFRSQCLYTLL